MGPKKQKLAQPSYKVHSPPKRAKPSHLESQISKKAYSTIAAIASAALVSEGKPRIPAGNLILGTPKIKNKYFAIAQKSLNEWIEKEEVPKSAIEYFKEHESSVWPNIPFVSEEILRSYASTDDHVIDKAAVLPQQAPPLNLLNQIDPNWVDIGEITIDGHDKSSQGQLKQRILEILSVFNVEFLNQTNRKSIRLSFRRILQHWAVDCRIAHEHLSKLLKLLKIHRPDFNSEIGKLPYSAKTLLKLNTNDFKGVQQSVVYNSRRELVGTYMHYGILDGVLGRSAGNH